MEMSATDTAFKLFDKDKDGFITRAEFAKVVLLDFCPNIFFPLCLFYWLTFQFPLH